jgi:hypothetical protein
VRYRQRVELKDSHLACNLSVVSLLNGQLGNHCVPLYLLPQSCNTQAKVRSTLVKPYALFRSDGWLLDLLHIFLFLLLPSLLLCHVYGGYLVDVLLAESGYQTLIVLSVDLVGLPRLQSDVTFAPFQVLEDLLVVNIFNAVFLMLYRLLVRFRVFEGLSLEAVNTLLSVNLLIFSS